jgi:hypothetical protein
MMRQIAGAFAEYEKARVLSRSYAPPETVFAPDAARAIEGSQGGAVCSYSRAAPFHSSRLLALVNR